MKKGSKIIKITDKDYVVLEDRWIGKNDKILYNQNNKEFHVLGFYVLTEEEKVSPYIDLKIKNNYSCVLLDKKITIGDILYIKENNISTQKIK